MSIITLHPAECCECGEPAYVHDIEDALCYSCANIRTRYHISDAISLAKQLGTNLEPATIECLDERATIEIALSGFDK